jgi:hypothetical protein
MPNRLRFALFIGLLIASPGCQTRQGASPGLEPQWEDYAQARKGFKTKLVRHGPSPQQGEPLQKPPGAEQIDYRSGDLVRKALGVQ